MTRFLGIPRIGLRILWTNIILAPFIAVCLFAKIAFATCGINNYSCAMIGNTIIDQNGNLELGCLAGTCQNPTNGATPFIDFHYGNGASQDFNMRVVNSADQRLEIGNASQSVITINGNKVEIGAGLPNYALDVNG
jgi:hypothetical protein